MKWKFLSLLNIKRRTTNTQTEINPSSNNALTYDWSSIRVLLVDDNEINLKLAKTLLTKRNIKVSTAEDGEQAIKLTDIYYYDIIFMDLQMPKVDGYMATQHIRTSSSACQNSIIIALTANAMPDEKIKITNVGMNDILIKPTTEKQLFDIFERHLSNSNDHISSNLITDNQDDEKNLMSKSDKLSAYDQAEGLLLSGGNPQLENELLTMLKNELPEHIEKLKSAMNDNDLSLLKSHVHKLHGACSYCGVTKLRHSANTLENSLALSETENLKDEYQAVLSDILELTQVLAENS